MIAAYRFHPAQEEKKFLHPNPAGLIRVLLFKQSSMELHTSTDVACYQKQVLLSYEHLHGVDFSKQMRKPLPNWSHGRAF